MASNTEAESNKPTAAGKEPEDLLVNVERSIMPRALSVSLIAHVAVVLLTSFSLYAAWVQYGIYREEYGFMTPANIRTLKKDVEKKKQEADRKARADAEVAKIRKKEDAKQASDEGKKPSSGDSGAKAPTDEEAPPVKEPQKLPRKKSISLDDAPDLGLDD